MRIMLVEDSGTFREEFKKQLCRLYPSAIVEEAANGEEAIPKITESPPEIVFMDLRLPGESGLRLIQEIKAKFPNIHIAMLTNYDSPEYRKAAFKFGADRYFVKDSFSWEEMRDLLNAIQRS